jgi:hypothetical protein
VTKTKFTQSVGGSAGDIKVRKTGIYVADVEGRLTRIAQPILVTAFATMNSNTPRESAFTEIKFETVEENGKRRLFPLHCSLLSQSNL